MSGRIPHTDLLGGSIYHKLITLLYLKKYHRDTKYFSCVHISSELGNTILFIHRSETIAVEANRLGWAIKGLETWNSTVLFEYSKKYHLSGSEVSCALKKASSFVSESNGGIRTLSNRISSYFSAAIAIAGVDHSPVAGYILAVVEASSALLSVATSVRFICVRCVLCPARDNLAASRLSDTHHCMCYREQMDHLTPGLSVQCRI